MAPLQHQYDLAVKIIQSMPKEGPLQPSTATRLLFYSYYKQVTVGQCSSEQPGIADVTNRAKWDAWNNLGGMSKEEAMKHYVDEFTKLLANSPVDSADANLKKMIEEFQAALK